MGLTGRSEKLRHRRHSCKDTISTETAVMVSAPCGDELLPQAGQQGQLGTNR